MSMAGGTNECVEPQTETKRARRWKFPRVFTASRVASPTPNLIRVHSHFLLCSSHIQQFHPHLLFAAMAGPLLLNKNNSGEVYVWPTLRHVVTSSLQLSSALCRRRASSQTIQAQSTLLPRWRCVTLLYSHTHKTNVSLFHLCS